jgi:hypothetical protein
LQSVVYELLMLASAVLLRDKRDCVESYPGLPWGPFQTSHDAMRLKCRLLLHFFMSRAQKPEDMRAKDFAGQHPSLDKKKLKGLQSTIAKFDPWTVHLSWKRTTDPEYSKADREAMERCAMVLLKTGADFIGECLACGVTLDSTGSKYHAAFKTLHADLARTPRVEEGKGPRPRSRIPIQDLK